MFTGPFPTDSTQVDSFKLLDQMVYLDSYCLEVNGVFMSLGSIFMVDLVCVYGEYTSWTSDHVYLRVFVVGRETPVSIPLGGLGVKPSEAIIEEHETSRMRRLIEKMLDELREGEFRVLAKETMRRVSAWQRNSQDLGMVASHAF